MSPKLWQRVVPAIAEVPGKEDCPHRPQITGTFQLLGGAVCTERNTEDRK